MSWSDRNEGVGRIGIAILILFMYGMAIAALCSVTVPAESRDALSLLFGGLSTALGGVVGYFFNISHKQASGGNGG